MCTHMHVCTCSQVWWMCFPGAVTKMVCAKATPRHHSVGTVPRGGQALSEGWLSPTATMSPTRPQQSQGHPCTVWVLLGVTLSQTPTPVLRYPRSQEVGSSGRHCSTKAGWWAQLAFPGHTEWLSSSVLADGEGSHWEQELPPEAVRHKGRCEGAGGQQAGLSHPVASPGGRKPRGG